MNRFVKFFHEFFNPHCSHCVEAEEIRIEMDRDSRRCLSCEALQLQLAVVNNQNKNLIEKLVNPNGIAPAVETKTENLKPITRGHVPFHVVRRVLEQEKRAEAAAIKNAAQPDKVLNSEPVNDEHGSSETQAQAEDVKPLEDLIFSAKVDREAEVGTRQA